jgi:hypothetical protein
VQYIADPEVAPGNAEHIFMKDFRFSEW